MPESESSRERLDRNLEQLMTELRVAMPGVQILFAFLLSVPFTQRFGRTTEIQRDLYYTTLILAALSTILFIAPSSQHRLLFRKRDKEALLFRSNAYAIAGLMCLGAALCAALLFVSLFLFSPLVGTLVTAALGAMLVLLWIVLPLRRRGAEPEDQVTEA